MHDILFSYVCSVVLFPVAVTFFITWWFIQFVDGFFSPLYAKLGIDIFGNCCTHTSELAVYGDSKFTERLYLDLLHILEDILLTCHPYSQLDLLYILADILCTCMKLITRSPKNVGPLPYQIFLHYVSVVCGSQFPHYDANSILQTLALC